MALLNKSKMIVTLPLVFLGARQSNCSKNFPLASPATCHIQKPSHGFVPYRCCSPGVLQQQPPDGLPPPPASRVLLAP